jgi:hypothetical protein
LADPATRAKMSAASKAALADPATRAKMSAARKAALAAKDDRDNQPQQRRTRADKAVLQDVPRDPLEAALFGGAR